MAMTTLDSTQVIKTVFDSDNEALKVSQVGSFQMEISATEGDSIMLVGTDDGTTSGDQRVVKVDTDGALISKPKYISFNVSSISSPSIKSGAGVIHSVSINTKGASSNSLVIYDSLTASGTKIATIDTTSSITTLIYDVQFSTGLTIDLKTGNAADITISYK